MSKCDVYSFLSFKDTEYASVKEMVQKVKYEFSDIQNIDNLWYDLRVQFETFCKQVLIPKFPNKYLIRYQLHYPKSSSPFLKEFIDIFDSIVVNGVTVEPKSVTESFKKSNDVWFDTEGYKRFLISKGRDEVYAQKKASEVEQLFNNKVSQGEFKVHEFVRNAQYPRAKEFVRGLFDIKSDLLDKCVNIDIIVDDILTTGTSIINMYSKLVSQGVNENNVFCITYFKY